MVKDISGQSSIIFTIGHSTRLLKDFVAILKSYKVKQIVDVRTIPRSRHNPQFNRETLPDDLSDVGIAYLHMPGLGGLRHPITDSSNLGWRNTSFRGFADYMQTEEFKESIDKLIEIAKKKQIVLMCAESVPWRCHRSLIADALQVRDMQVKHIMSQKSCKDHILTPWIKVHGFKITYPLATTISKRAK